MEVMAEEAVSTIEQFSQQNLANLAWAYGKLAINHSQLIDAIAARACAMISVSVTRVHADAIAV